MSGAGDARRSIPQIHRLADEVAPSFPDLPRPIVIDATRAVVETARRRARRTKVVPSEDELVAMVTDELSRRRRQRLQPVVNATGVVLHTNLGRAPLSERALEAVVAIARGYSNLEWDTEHGRRGDRYVHVEPLIAAATGAEAALVVNNNAAGVLLVCASLAAGSDERSSSEARGVRGAQRPRSEVIVSRGELIEIGGEFRIPEILATSGATLREVGTTNRTHLRDYERAVNDGTAFILKVHPSNYRVVGFTAAPDTKDLASLARKHRIPLVYDVGSGLLGRPLADEPLVTEALSEGADLVCFSGDKLLGGPQAGIVAGRSELIDRLRVHPLLRAIRPDKMQLAALGATVESYLVGDGAGVPVVGMLSATEEEIERRARRLARRLRSHGYETEIASGHSAAGGGSLPGHEVPTKVLRIRHQEHTTQGLVSGLRRNDPPVVARAEAGRLVLDLRTVLPAQDRELVAALVSLV